MKDLMRSKKIVSKRVVQPKPDMDIERNYIQSEDLDDEIRSCNSNKYKQNCYSCIQCDCEDNLNNCNNNSSNNCSNNCNNNSNNNCCCNQCCDDCSDCDNCCDCNDCLGDCFENPCGPQCSKPLTVSKFPISQAVLYPIETNRIYDTIMFRVFTDGKFSNGEELKFEYELENLCGSLPSCNQTNVTIEKVCINYTNIVINPGTTSLEDLNLNEINKQDKNCRTVFEYNVCGQLNKCCNSQCLGQNIAYKEKGLNVVVKGLEIELTGRFGCSEFTAIAKPTGNKDVVFFFNTLSSDVVVPSDGRGCFLRQDFQTQLTVDCIGKGLITQQLVNNKPCYKLQIPNGIDLVLCLQNVVSVLIEEQIVVLGGPSPVKPKLVDTFGSVCDFSQFNGSCDNNTNNIKNNNCSCC